MGGVIIISSDSRTGLAILFVLVVIAVCSTILTGFPPLWYYTCDIILYTTAPLVAYFVLLDKRKARMAMVVLWLFIVYDFWPQYLDIPNAVSANYSYVEGRPGDIEQVNISKRRYKRVTIQDNTFRVYDRYAYPISPEKKYRITYLPTSRYVVWIEELK